MKWIAIFLFLCGTAYADTETIMPELIEQMGYKVSRPMSCNWPGAEQTTVFGYYGHKSPREVSPAPLSTTRREQDAKAGLFQKHLELPTKTAFGMNLELEFYPEHMSHDGMQLQLVEIDYKPLNKRCPAGFGSGLMTR